MARRPNPDDPELLRAKLGKLLDNFKHHLKDSDLRDQVLELVSANYLLRDIGSSLMKDGDGKSARDRILLYLKKYIGQVIHGDELMVVSGISEYARRVRELRVQEGWAIISGVTVSEIRQNADDDDELAELPVMKPDEYLLQFPEQDKEAAHRWHQANEIRKSKKLGVRDKILLFLRGNTGKIISGEELRYVAGKKSEWARRVRELRTEYGWPITTKSSGRPDLPVGTYVLEKDQQSPPHDRTIKDSVRREVLKRDGYTCQRKGCNWTHDLWNPSDPRHLEAHHIQHHVKGGSNEANNLITYCNICHDIVHREEGREKA